jgi:hypothetical protein
MFFGDKRTDPNAPQDAVDAEIAAEDTVKLDLLILLVYLVS